MSRRRGMVAGTDSRVDFAFAEMLAFSTLSLRRPPGMVDQPPHVMHLIELMTHTQTQCTMHSARDECRDLVEDQSAKAIERRAAQGLNYSHFGVRLSGQDSQRGTFNQRHAVIHDVKTGFRDINVSHVHPTQDQIEVYNSPLSEAAVLAFEYGHSVASKDSALVLWEVRLSHSMHGASMLCNECLAAKHCSMPATVALAELGYSQI